MNFRPAEWQKNKTIFLAWPYDVRLWGDDLLDAQQEFLALVFALSDERVVVIVPTENELKRVAVKLAPSDRLSLKVLAYGDIWLRDTFPIFVEDERGQTRAVIPRFNGWGNKYPFADDLDLSRRAAKLLNTPTIEAHLTFEGGAIDCDGASTLLTTEHCLLNPNRNPHASKLMVEQEFARLFGTKKTIWLKEGLKNDHTDSHIDTLARFIKPHTIAIMNPCGPDDPNYEVLLAIKAQLLGQTDAQNRPIEIVEIPSPGAVVSRAGVLLPASSLNFIMGDKTLLVPLYGTPYDDEVLGRFKASVALNVIGLSAKAILSGGGAFHCISQEFYGEVI